MNVESIERATSAAAAILPEAETGPICQAAVLEEDCMTAMDPEFSKEGASDARLESVRENDSTSLTEARSRNRGGTVRGREGRLVTAARCGRPSDSMGTTGVPRSIFSACQLVANNSLGLHEKEC